MRKLTSKGKHTVKGRKSSTNTSNPAIIRRGVQRQDIRNAFEMHLKLRDQHLEQSCVCVCVYIYRERKGTLYQNLMVTANQKSTIDTHRKEKLIQTKHLR